MCKKSDGRWVHVGIVSHGEGYVHSNEIKDLLSWFKMSKLNTCPKNIQSLNTRIYLYFSGL